MIELIQGDCLSVEKSLAELATDEADNQGNFEHYEKHQKDV